jgi:histidine triad (HIT) family protein
MADCIFCKIAGHEIPSETVYEDEKVIAIRDINPQAPVHVILIPKKHVETLNKVTDFTVYADVFKAVNEVAMKTGIQEKGYRVVANCNRDGGQTVFHIHFHVLGGRSMKWPPG